MSSCLSTVEEFDSTMTPPFMFSPTARGGGGLRGVSEVKREMKERRVADEWDGGLRAYVVGEEVMFRSSVCVDWLVRERRGRRESKVQDGRC